jgi:hypothetical protein
LNVLEIIYTTFSFPACSLLTFNIQESHICETAWIGHPYVSQMSPNVRKTRCKCHNARCRCRIKSR